VENQNPQHGFSKVSLFSLYSLHKLEKVILPIPILITHAIPLAVENVLYISGQRFDLEN
jgi:hypothetical protein